MNSPYVKYHSHSLCHGKEHLLEEANKIFEAKGEGMMIKSPKCQYERSRSDQLLKVKQFFDTEATVIGHQKGTGRCWDMCGALLMKGDNGIKFKIGSGFTDAQRKSPPKIGSRVTYKYQGLTNDGLPRFPIFLRIHPGM